MNSSISVAVLLAAYNGEKWIKEQIKTILNQKDVCLDLYISLDLSSDNTQNIITELSEHYSQIILLPYGQKFGGAAPNFYHLLLNVPVGKYDYIALADQDDIWAEDKLYRAINVLETRDASGYSSDITAFWENGKSKIIKKSYPQCEYDFLFESPGPGCSFVLKSELTLSMKNKFTTPSLLNGFDWHDWVIYAFARANKYGWVIDDNSHILYRQHIDNQLGANDGYVAFFKRIKDIVSGYGINQSLGIVKLLGLEKEPFVSKWYKNGRVDYWTLAFNAKKCRRRKRDKILFFFACMLMLLRRPKIIN